MTPGSPNERLTDHYIAVTGDAGVGCFNDQVWFSPSCRGNTTRCVPLMIQYFFERAMQLATFLDLPLAVVMVGPGSGSYDEYYRAARAGRFLFGHWSPDDLLVDPRGRQPVLLGLPRADPAEQARGIFRTGAASQQLRSYVWRELQGVDPQVSAREKGRAGQGRRGKAGITASVAQEPRAFSDRLSEKGVISIF